MGIVSRGGVRDSLGEGGGLGQGMGRLFMNCYENLEIRYCVCAMYILFLG